MDAAEQATRMFAIVLEPRARHWIAAQTLGRIWPAVCWGHLGAVRELQIDRPALPAGEWVLLRTRLGGICGTDLGMVRMQYHPGSVLRAYLPGRMVLGHENVAEVVEAGAEAGEWKPGRRVVADSALGCAARGIWPPCGSCAAGLLCLCENLDRGAIGPAVMLGVADFAGGSWGEYFVAHRAQLHAVPEDLDDELAVLIDPVACAVHGVLRCWPRPGERVAVLGGGIVAMAAIAALRALGWAGSIDALVRSGEAAGRARAAGANRVAMLPRWGRVVERLAPVAEALGARLVRGRYGNAMLAGGYDLVYEAAGGGASLSDAAKITRARGCVALLGTPQIVMAEMTPVWLRELRLVGCYGRQIESQGGRTRHTYEVVLDLLREGRLRLDAWRAAIWPARRWREALAAAAGLAGPRPVKAALDFREGRS